MFSKEVIKITAFSIFFFLTFLAVSSQKALASGGNCKEFYGNYYIADEFYRACGIYVTNPNQCPSLSSVNAFSTESSCLSASIQRYGCTPSIAESVIYAQTGNQSQISYQSNTITMSNALSCLDSLQSNKTSSLPYCQNGVKFFQCKCSKTLVGEAGSLGEVVSWITGSDTYSCYLKAVVGTNFVKVNEVKVKSPIALIKSVTDVLFYVAVILFIVNLLRAGLAYIQSEGVPDDLKKSRSLLSNTMSGMVFFLLVSGLILYIANAFKF